MPITPVNTTPVGLGYTIQQASDTENGVDAAFAGGMATADAIRQKVTIQPYVDAATVAQSKNIEGAANAGIALRPAEENLRNAEIRGAVYDHDINDKIASDVKNRANQQRARLLEFEDTLFPKQKEAMISAQNAATDDAAVSATVSGVRRTKAQQIAATVGNLLEAENARSTVAMSNAAKQHKDPLGQAKALADSLLQDGIAIDYYETPLPEIVKRFRQNREEKLDEIERLTALMKKMDTAPQMKQEESLRKEFNDRPNVSRFYIVDDNFSKLKATAANANPSSTDDIATVYAFMKMQDPGSSVLTSEYATVGNAAGVPERIRRVYNKLRDGEALTPEMRKELVQTATKVHEAQKLGFDRTKDEFARIAMAFDLPPSRILGREYLPKPADGEAPTGGDTVPTAGGKPAAPTAPKGTRRLVGLDDGTKVYGYETVDPTTGVATYTYDLKNATAPPKPATPAPPAPVAAPTPAPVVAEPVPAPETPAGPVIRPAQPKTESLFGGRNVPDASSPGGWKKVPWGTPTTPPPE